MQSCGRAWKATGNTIGIELAGRKPTVVYSCLTDVLFAALQHESILVGECPKSRAICCTAARQQHGGLAAEFQFSQLPSASTTRHASALDCVAPMQLARARSLASLSEG